MAMTTKYSWQNLGTKMDKKTLKDAHDHSNDTKSEFYKSKNAGCFSCEKIFKPEEVIDWISGDFCAECPYCGIDSVIGDSSGYAITPEFLEEMNEHWLGGHKRFTDEQRKKNKAEFYNQSS